jgi:hypothetical protein
MALIPLSYKLDWYNPSEPGGILSTINDNANTATSFGTQYSMQEIIDTVAASGGGPFVPYLSGTDQIARTETFHFGDGYFGNTSLGFGALQSLNSSDAQYNVAIGYQAGTGITDGSKNVCIGGKAGDGLTSGDYNVVIGYDAAGFGAFTGSENVFIGRNAGIGITSGWGNVAVGDGALGNENDMDGSVAIGKYALALQQANIDPYNVAVGYEAGKAVTIGQNNTLVGTRAGSTGTNDLTEGQNCLILGNYASASAATVSNEITLGNSSIATIRAQVTTITALSDERDKKDIVDLEQGLAMVKQLKPRQFVWDHRAEKRIVREATTDADGNPIKVDKEEEFYSARKGAKDVGFIAQELQTVDNEWIQLVSASNPDKLEASYGKLVPVLVKAIQELAAEIDALK